jgi:hypothetical protein
MMKHAHRPGSALALAASVVLAVSACGGSSSQPAPKPGPQAPGSSLALPAARVSFGSYHVVPLANPDSPPYAGPATPHSLANLALPASERYDLKHVPALAPMLEKQGFAVVRSGSSLFQNEYEGNIYGGFPVYVTTDAAYNSWHLVFDKTLRDLEQEVLLPKLEQLVTLALRNAQDEARASAGTTLADAASRVEQLYELAAAELGLKTSLGPLAEKEKALVDAHDVTASSPITGTTLDYSLFTPRGHYTLTPALERFFVAMSVLGQIAFCLPGTSGCQGVAPAREGILAAAAIADDAKADALWHKIYEPTAFLVGLADDYTPDEVAAAVRDAGVGGLKRLGSDATVNAVVTALTKARKVRIDPGRASIRIMGTRFVLDSYLLDQLIYPNVGTAGKPRALPSALDLASAFGSAAAAKTEAAAGATAYKNFGAQMKKVQGAVESRPPAAWGSTVYAAWLYALQPMFARHGAAYPDYMRSAAWAAKDLQSGLGSYTELKHDTILFAKEPVAEAGGEPLLKTPLNWVEPDPVAFERLEAAADLLRQGLAARGLLTDEAAGLLDTDSGLFRFLAHVATGELAGQTLAPADNIRLRNIGDALAAIWYRTAQRTEAASLPDQAAVVADIAAAPNAVLEEATGEIDTLYVIVPGAKGTFELARGGVYSYYEFTTPPSTRLSDIDWRAMLQAGKAPARPAWESVFRVPCPPAPKALRKYNLGCSPADTPG